MAGSGHGKGGAQIVGAVGQHIRQGQLGAGEDHGQVDVRQHEGDGGGGVSHGIGAMGDHDAVEALPLAEDLHGDGGPLLRGDVGRVQAHDVPDGDIVIGTKLVDLSLHDFRPLGLQSLAAGHGSDGTAGGHQQDLLFLHNRILQEIRWVSFFTIYYIVPCPK